ncbi:hypothetical protein ID866_7128 [Astraeus odoratus]|nr:hypothetical protein ID866_7128 [Astraeus odoratus]
MSPLTDARQHTLSPRASADHLCGQAEPDSFTRADSSSGSGKGKDVAHVEPLAIPTLPPAHHDAFDSPSISHFFVGPGDPDPLTSSFYSSLFSLGSSHVHGSARSTALADDSVLHAPSHLASPPDRCDLPDSSPCKGKGREVPPTLPPLSFSPTEFRYSSLDWPCAEPSPHSPGPSSWGSGHTSLSTASSAQSQPSLAQEAGSLEGPSRRLCRRPALRRSHSNFSIRSARSSATQSMTKFKLKLGSSSKTPVQFARKLLSKNKSGDGHDESPTGTESSLADQPADQLLLGEERCAFPWQGLDDGSKSPPSNGVAELDSIAAIISEMVITWDTNANQTEPVAIQKGKSRSYSSPFPKSVFDFVPQFEPNVFMPLSFHHVRNVFDEVLPRELRLRIFSTLIKLHVEEHDELVRSGKWTCLKASSSKNRWMGRNRAMRELVKFSRVSKTWRSLVFDGQLWEDVDLQAFQKLPHFFLSRLAEHLGSFVKNLDLSGHTGLAPDTLVQITNSFCVHSRALSFAHTQLTTINLQGCINLTTQSLHGLLMRSPYLRTLCVKGLKAVTNATFDVLALYASEHLTSLNMSRCTEANGEGVRGFAAAILARGARLALKEFRLSGIEGIDDDALSALGKAAPELEILDLSYCSDLHNSALAAFVSCTEENQCTSATVTLSAREAGLETRDSRRHIRRVTALRHLSLSHCILLTDIACSNLAYTLPRLELLELAGIGAELHDEGLIRLLNTTPLLRRLDLEDASSITDAVLGFLTPVDDGEPSPIPGRPAPPPQLGHALEHLVVSYASRLTNEAFLALIRGCPKLRVLEADSTLISGSVLREFVKRARERECRGAGLVAVDCRLISEHVVKEVAAHTRPRKGWRSWEARKLGYLDARDGEDLKVGQDECDEERVILKSFYNWQTVDAVRAARERKRKAMKKAHSNESLEKMGVVEEGKWTGRMKWWSPSRRSSGNNTPRLDDGDRDGCIVM